MHASIMSKNSAGIVERPGRNRTYEVDLHGWSTRQSKMPISGSRWTGEIARLSERHGFTGASTQGELSLAVLGLEEVEMVAQPLDWAVSRKNALEVEIGTLARRSPTLMADTAQTSIQRYQESERNDRWSFQLCSLLYPEHKSTVGPSTTRIVFHYNAHSDTSPQQAFAFKVSRNLRIHTKAPITLQRTKENSHHAELADPNASYAGQSLNVLSIGSTGCNLLPKQASTDLRVRGEPGEGDKWGGREAQFTGDDAVWEQTNPIHIIAFTVTCNEEGHTVDEISRVAIDTFESPECGFIQPHVDLVASTRQRDTLERRPLWWDIEGVKPGDGDARFEPCENAAYVDEREHGESERRNEERSSEERPSSSGRWKVWSPRTGVGLEVQQAENEEKREEGERRMDLQREQEDDDARGAISSLGGWRVLRSSVKGRRQRKRRPFSTHNDDGTASP
ncbi:hypothetical protein BKA70DRAFT_1408256 [Coprinopsis sp. MPI-PUGE-AT-0042]|nr:hypothetical protein BKA70DRAFT_1408256 [Coprinopsis sp. MPI-PUGE-AT-0042]